MLHATIINPTSLTSTRGLQKDAWPLRLFPKVAAFSATGHLRQPTTSGSPRKKSWYHNLGCTDSSPEKNFGSGKCLCSAYRRLQWRSKEKALFMRLSWCGVAVAPTSPQPYTIFHMDVKGPFAKRNPMASTWNVKTLT